MLGRGGNVAAKKAKATAEGLDDGEWEWSQVDITDEEAVATAAAEGNARTLSSVSETRRL